MDKWAALLAAGALAIAAGSCSSGDGGLGASHRARFAAGNAAYEKGSYEEAAAIYEEIASAGVVSAALQYNLGNALFKSGRLGPAILAYERARRQDPRDPDIRENLEYLRTLTTDRIPPAPSPLTALGLTYLLDLTSSDQDAVVFLWAWILAGCAFGVTIAAGSARIRRAALWAAAALAVIAIVTGASLATKSYLESARGAIVLAGEVNVLSGAGEENPTLFTVHEGLKVTVHSRSGEWVQVSLENGLAGWLPASALEEI